MELILREQKKYISSLELLEEINFFRKQEGNRTKLKHNDLLKIIRDEFEEEIAEGNISLGSYKDKQNQLRPQFELTISQAKQVLVRESKVVRKAVIKAKLRFFPEIVSLENKIFRKRPIFHTFYNNIKG